MKKLLRVLALTLLCTGYSLLGQVPDPNAIPRPPIVQDILLPSVDRAITEAQRFNPGNPSIDAILTLLDSPLIRMLDDLTLNRTDEHLGDDFYAIMDPTGRLLIPSAASPAEALIFGAEMEGTLINALIAAQPAQAANLLVAYLTAMSTVVPNTAITYGKNIPEFLQDEVHRVIKILYYQTIYFPEFMNFVLDTTIGVDRLKSKLELHLVAEDIVGVAEGAKVTSWPDRSAARRLVSAPVGLEPVWVPNGLNGKPSVRFERARGTCFDFELPHTLHNQPYTVFIVFKADFPAPPSQDVLTLLGGTTHPSGGVFRDLFVHRSIITEEHPRIWAQPYAAVYNLSSTRFLTNDAWVVEGFAFNPDESFFRLYRNGDQDGGSQLLGEQVLGTDMPVGPGEFPRLGLWRIGDIKRGGEALQGEIAELRIYEGELTPSERDTVNQEISDRYGMNHSRHLTLLEDTYNAADANSLDEGLVGRQTGSLRNVSHRSVGGNRWIRNNTARLSTAQTYKEASWSAYSPNFDFKGVEQNNSFRMRVKMIQSDGPVPAFDPGYLAADTINETLGQNLVLAPFETLRGVIDQINAVAGQTVVRKPEAFPYLFAGSWAAVHFRNQPLRVVNDPAGVGVHVYSAGALVIWINQQAVFVGPISGGKTHDIDIRVVNNLLTVFVNGVMPPPNPGGKPFPLEIPPALNNFVTFQSLGTQYKLDSYTAFDDFNFSIQPERDHQEGNVILTDNFDVADSENLNSELSTRQAGVRAPATYLVASRAQGAKASINGNRLALTPSPNGMVIASPKVNFLPVDGEGNFRLRASLTPGKGPGDRWVGLKFRNLLPLESVNEGDGFGLLVRENGVVEMFEGLSGVANTSVPPAESYFVEAVVEDNFLRLSVNGVPVSFGPAATFFLNPQDGNHVSFIAYASGTQTPPASFVDDFEFTTFRPLPPPPPVVSLQITQIAPGQVQVKWPKLEVPYTLEFRDDFFETSFWDVLSLEVEDLGAFDGITDNTDTFMGQRYYRLSF